MNSRSQISIWFFVGSLLLIYGVVATASSLVNHDAAGRTVLLAELHPDILWGVLLLALGGYSRALWSSHHLCEPLQPLAQSGGLGPASERGFKGI